MNRINCPGCGHRLKYPDEHSGKRVKCPKCGGSLQLPAVPVPAAGGGVSVGVAQPGPVPDAPRLPGVAVRPNGQVGPYTLIRELGRGGFGSVWLAERRTSLATTQVAVKLPLDGEPDLDAIRQEAQLWAQASGHPNVLPVIEAAVYDGQVVIVSEYAPGGSVASWLHRHGGRAPSLDTAVALARGVLAGLAHLHARRIVHRDVKPANILLQGEYPRLTDFGLSRVLRSTALSARVSGTPAYMAPEAWNGQRSEQTDLWAVGVLLQELICGALPFPQPDMIALMKAILMDPPAPLPGGVPVPLRGVIERALQKDLQQRYRSAAEMLRGLEAGPGAAAAPPVPATPPEKKGFWQSLKQLGRGVLSGPAAPAAPTRPTHPAPVAPGTMPGGNPDHPLAGAGDAAELFKAITAECCEYSDGSGEVDAKAARRLFRGLGAGDLWDALASSPLAALAKLAKLLPKLSEKVGHPACRELEELRGAVIEATKVVLPQARDAGEVKGAVAAACCEYDGGSGDVHTKQARQLFDRLDVAGLRPGLADSSVRDLNNLSHVLERVGGEVGRNRCPGLEELRSAVREAAAPALAVLGVELARAEDAEQLRQIITSACCEHDDGSGDVNATAVRALFDGLDGAAVAGPLAASSLKSLSQLLQLLRRIAERLKDAEQAAGKGVEAFRTAVLEASRAALPHAVDAEELRGLVCRACLEYDDGSGDVYAKPARTLFDGLDPAPLAAALAESGQRPLNQLGRALDTLAKALGARRSDGLDRMREMVKQAGRGGLQAAREALPHAGDAEQLRALLTGACCEHDDGSGQVYELAVRYLLEGLAPEALAPALAGSTPEATRKLARTLQRMSSRLGGCQELERLRMTVSRAAGLLLPHAGDAEQLCALITACCCEWDDASGNVTVNLARPLFEGLRGHQFTSALAGSDPRARSKLAQALQRISQAVGHPRCEGLEELRQAVR